MVKLVEDDFHYTAIRDFVNDVMKPSVRPGDAVTTLPPISEQHSTASAHNEECRARSAKAKSPENPDYGSGLRSLAFPEIQDREEQIIIAHEGS
jgi:hypothetical protein